MTCHQLVSLYFMFMFPWNSMTYTHTYFEIGIHFYFETIASHSHNIKIIYGCNPTRIDKGNQ